ncbi:MAG: hydroxymethylbilane synthase [Chloroflexota bacterium]|nr:hydroxymethylbilane synthase [Chloroflexota bacterium]
MIQTQWTVERLRHHWPNLEITIEQISTIGDRVTDKPLAQIGGDGVFITEIERALHERRIDLAVHSLKDLPTAQPEGLLVMVAGNREDVRDVFVSTIPFSILEKVVLPLDTDVSIRNLRIGTCSLRRMAQLQVLCPDAQILPIRGNVDTRLRKLEAGDYDGIVLAAAGLHRMDLQEQLADRITYFPIEAMMPAPGQGALGLEIRDEPEMRELLAPLHDRETQAATSAERMFMRHLGAGCYLPVAAYGAIVESTFTLAGLVISLDGKRQIRVQQSMPWIAETNYGQAEQLGRQLAEQALAQGADDIIKRIDAAQRQEYQHA